jgi:CRP-like cAMP-binding protein
VVTIRNGSSVSQRWYYLDERGQAQEVAPPRSESPQAKFPAQGVAQDQQQFEQMVLQNQEKVRQQILQAQQQMMQKHQEMMQMQQTPTFDGGVFGGWGQLPGSTLSPQRLPFPVANRQILPRRR